MSANRREIYDRVNHGSRKTPSTDLLVIPDKDRTAVPLTHELLIKANGNEGKIFETLGYHNSESERPAIIRGLSHGRTNDTHHATALSHLDSRFAAHLLGKQFAKDFAAELGFTEDADDDTRMNFLANWPADASLSGFKAGESIHELWPARMVADDISLVGRTAKSGSKPLEHNSAILHSVLGRSVKGNGQFDNLSDSASLVSILDGSKTNAEICDASSGWQTAFAMNAIQMPGDYIRANSGVLKDLMSHLPYFKELDMVGFFQKGFRGTFWSKFSTDELRVMGEMIHLGMSLRHGSPLRNCHYNNKFVAGPASTTGPKQVSFQLTSITGVPLAAGPARAILREMIVGSDSALDTLYATAVNGVLTFEATGPSGPVLSTAVTDGLDRGKIHIDRIDSSSPSGLVPSIVFSVDRGDKETIIQTVAATSPEVLLNGDYNTARHNKLLKSQAIDAGQIIGDKGSLANAADTLVQEARIDSWNASIGPFFVHIEDGNAGSIVAGSDELNGRSSLGMESRSYFACVPGLEGQLSPALVGELQIQPQARDITLEDLWMGLSWLFESDTTEMAGRHHASISKFIRDLSPDFKTGAIHDFRSTGARTDTDMIKAGYLLGNKRLDQIRLGNSDPINPSEAFFTRNSTRPNLVNLYSARGFISETARTDVVEDISDLSKRNFQTTNDFIRGQQMVGEAKTNVYHAQLGDGSEHNIEFGATLMSLGSWRHVAPSQRWVSTSLQIEPMFRTSVDFDGVTYNLQPLYDEFTRQHFPNTRDWADLAIRRPGVPTFMPMHWTQSWAGLRTLCKTSFTAVPTDVDLFALSGVNKVETLRLGTELDSYSTLGDYFLDLSISNPMRTFLDLTGDVYKHIRNATAGLPYKGNITLQDLIEINLVKQVTLSTGSPALQQMLDGFLMYGYQNDGTDRAISRKMLERKLWDRAAHPRDGIYTRQSNNLYPFILPPTVNATDLPSLISSTNVFLHDVGLTGALMDGKLSILPSMCRTTYVNYVDAMGNVFDHAITSPSERFNLQVDSPCLSPEASPGAVIDVTTALFEPGTYLPGFRYFQTLYDNSPPSICYKWQGAGADTVGTDATTGLQSFSTQFAGFSAIGLGNTDHHLLNSEVGTSLVTELAATADATPPVINAAGVRVTDGTYFTAIDNRIIRIEVVNDVSAGTASLTVVPNKGFHQIGRRIGLWSTEALVNSGDVPDIGHIVEASLTAPTTFGIDTIGVIAAAARFTGDDATTYITRKPSYALVCQDVFDRDHQILSLMYHDMNGQRFVGPYSYAAFYDYAGQLLSTLSYSLTLVGSGQQVKGDAVVSTQAADDIISGDDTNEATSEDLMEDDDS